MRTIRTISRLFVGLVFVFSGFVKGVDPMGTMFKIEDYFIAFGTEFAMPVALPLSFLLCAIEFVLGMALIFNIRIRPTIWLTLLMMGCFTIMTFFDAIYSPVPDCGCFGEAIILSNWQTFYKNLLLMVFVLILFAGRKKIHSSFRPAVQNGILGMVTALFLTFSAYCYTHLPVIDFRDWKVGKDMMPDDAGNPIAYLKYKNLQTGAEKEWQAKDLPWDDSLWMASWTFVDQRIDDSHVKKAHDLQIVDPAGNDLTEAYIGNPDYQLLFLSYDLEAASSTALQQMVELYQAADSLGYSCVMLTNALDEQLAAFRVQYPSHLEVYNADDIVLKTMVRSNPGLLLMKDGVVMGKWHYRNFPGVKDLQTQFPDLLP